MIKFNIVLIAIYILLRGGINLYIRGLSHLDLLRISVKKYTKSEELIFMLSGFLYIMMWICIVISCVMILFKYL